MSAPADAAPLSPVPPLAPSTSLLDAAGPASRALLARQIAGSTGQDEAYVATLVEQAFERYASAVVRTYLSVLVEREVKQQIANPPRDGELPDAAAA